MFRLATRALVLAACTLPLFAQATPEPDVIVGDLTDTHLWGSVPIVASTDSILAYSVGTLLANVGTTSLTWNPNTSAHAVVAQNLYRLKNGRFQQIGMSWVKHTGSSTTGATLNVNGTDVSSAVQNGSQALLGPRNEVNAATGAFPYPVAGTYPSPGSLIDRRLQVLVSNVHPNTNPGALYFAEGQVIHPQDAASNVNTNNASYRAVSVTPGTYDLTFQGPTQQSKPAIQAWQDADPSVQIAIVDVPGDGRLLVGFKATPLNGMDGQSHYEYAVQNLSCDRGVGSFSVATWPYMNPCPPLYEPLVQGQFCGAPCSGEPYSGSAWTLTGQAGTLFPGWIKWATEPHAVNPYANALRWGSLYNFAFNSTQFPGSVTLGLFKPGTPATITIPAFHPTRRPLVPYTAWSNVTQGSDYVDISTTGSPGPMGDDASFAVPIGFTFPFYSHGYTSVVISTNGYLTFPGQDGNVASNTTLPGPGNPHGMIAGYWDDLDCSHLFDIRYQTIGNRFVVCWNCTHAGDTQPLKFELVLEQDGTILSNIVQCPYTFGGASATRGLENPTGTDGLLTSFDTPYSVASGQTVKYLRNFVSSTLVLSGRVTGGQFKIFYATAPNTPILTIAAPQSGYTYLGTYGALQFDINSVIGISDYVGIVTGVQDPTAVTNAAGFHELDMWIPPGAIPSGVAFYLGGVDFPANPADSINGWFNISNVVVVSG